MVDRAIFIGYNGALNQQQGIDTLANNIANINTVGYRAQRPVFSDLFSRVDRVATETANGIQTGHGSDLSAIDTLFNQGELKQAGTFSDLAVLGDGFFVLKDVRLPAAFQTLYTRAGNFTFDAGITDAGSGNPFTSGGQVVHLREQPTYTTLPRLIDPASRRTVQGYLANNEGVIQTQLVDLSLDPNAKDPAQETKTYNVRGSIDASAPAQRLSLLKDSSIGQLAFVDGKYNANQDRGVLTVDWNSDGSGSWKFLKLGQTVPDDENFKSFSSETVKANRLHTFIPGITFRLNDVTLTAGSFSALVGPYDVTKNTTNINSIQGVYLGNREDGTVTVTTGSSGAVSWSFVPDGRNFISESGSGTFATADSALGTLIPGITLKKQASTALSAGTLTFKTKHADDTTGAVGALYDDSSPNTQHTLITVFKKIQQNEYGFMVAGQTTEEFADTAITSYSNGQKKIDTYGNIDRNQITLRRVPDNTILRQAFSTVLADSGSNLDAASVRGSYWKQDLSGRIGMTINADGSGSWTFTPQAQNQTADSGTFAAGVIKPNTTYSLANGNEIVPGLVFTTGSAPTAAGTVSLDSTVGDYNTKDNRVTFSPAFSAKMTSLTKFLVDYKFDGSTFTNESATAGTKRYQGNARFDGNGHFLTDSGIPAITFKPNSQLDNLEITSTLTDVKQVDGPDALSVTSVDGNVEGFLTRLEFTDRGILLGVFSNGRERNLAQVVLARFGNNGGLSRAGDTSFFETAASGAATLKSIDEMTPGIASISPKTLEYSNSQLADELSDLIFFQRAFQFNSRAIRAADELVQSAISMKR